MAATDDALIAVVSETLNLQKSRPKPILPAMEWLARTMDLALPKEPIARLVSMLETDGPNSPVRLALLNRIQAWDHVEGPAWAPGTAPHSDERRSVIVRELGFDAACARIINAAIPLF